jgi:hypothetical protein
MGRLGGLDDSAALREVTAALDAGRAAREAAGPAVRIHVGSKVLRWGV